MLHLHATLDRAGLALRRSVETVHKDRAHAAAPSHPPVLHPRRADSPLDQSIAALHAVVWIASFVQSIFNEIAGRSDDL